MARRAYHEFQIIDGSVFGGGKDKKDRWYLSRKPIKWKPLALDARVQLTIINDLLVLEETGSYRMTLTLTAEPQGLMQLPAGAFGDKVMSHIDISRTSVSLGKKR